MNWTPEQLKEAEQRIQAHAHVTAHHVEIPAKPGPKPGRIPASTSERQVLRVVLQLLKHHPKVAWARRINTGKLQGVRFGFVGCSDVIGQMKDGRFLAVECKRLNGRAPTVAQTTFVELVRRNNGIAGIVRSVEDLMALLGA